VLLLAAVSVAVFAATEILPGDAVQARTAGRASQQQLLQLRAEAGLDRPAWRRYLDWLDGLPRGDAGRSLVNGRPVRELIAQRLPATATLTGAAFAVTVPLMMLLAWTAARGRRAARRAAAVFIGAGAAVPQVVVVAGLVAVFAGMLAWLPPVSLIPTGSAAAQVPRLLVLPALALALPAAAYGAGLMRGAIEDAFARPHVSDAVLRGLPVTRVAVSHVLPFLLAPALRLLAVIAGGLVASAALVETMFGYAGLGELLVSAAATRDAPVVQAVAMLGAGVVLLGLLLADLAAALTESAGTS
jgi:peptide/nickel transport system permease protein